MTVQQLEMRFERPERSVEELRAELFRHGGCPLKVAITRNRVSMASVRFDASGGARVRVHGMFLRAPDEVITALGRYLAKRSRREWNVVAAYVKRQAESSRRHASACHGTGDGAGTLSVAPRSKGRVYDLGLILEDINRRFFDGKIRCGIGWGRRGTVRRRARMRMVRFGSYSPMENAIRINPMLDDERIEREFVEYIVFHEMLHAALPSVKGRGRDVHHHRAYRMLERRFPGHERMQKLASELVAARERGVAGCERSRLRLPVWGRDPLQTVGCLFGTGVI